MELALRPVAAPPGKSVSLLVLLAMLLAGCREAPDLPTPAPAGSTPPLTAPWFEDATEQLGVRFVHDAGPIGKFFFPELVGSGVALFDYDGDERLDLYFLQNAGRDSSSPNQLFHQEGDGTFTNLSAGSGLDVAGRGMGVAVGDVDNDGRPDVLICEYGGARLFRNEGSGKFADLTANTAINHSRWACAAAFFDYDRDGWQDLVIVNYVEYDESRQCTGPNGKPDYCGPTAFTGLTVSPWRGTGFGAVFADFDQDGHVDLAVTNGRVRRAVLPSPNADLTETLDPFWGVYAERNQLFTNQGAGKFQDVSLANDAFCKMPRVGRGLACGDLDGDGAVDLVATYVASPARLYRNISPQRGHWLIVRALEPAFGGRDAYGAKISVIAAAKRWTNWIAPGSSYQCSNDPRAHFGPRDFHRGDHRGGSHVARWDQGKLSGQHR